MTRRYDIDAMRGILLLLMALTHLPTGLNPYANQPLGFVSAAEGFVFLSAFLVGSIYAPQVLERGVEAVGARLWKRARQLYRYHLGLLLFAFVIVGGIALWLDSEPLHNLLLPFFRLPGWASIAAPLLLYQPPLMDILPMYIVFLASTPLLLRLVLRRGWGPLLLLSALIWTGAQLGLARLLYDAVAGAGYPLPRDAWSSFDWFGWQLVWVSGLWLGSRRYLPSRSLHAAPAARESRLAWMERQSGWRRSSTYALAVAVIVASVLFCARHHIGGVLGSLDAHPWITDKWHLGPLRVANFAVLGVVVHGLILPLLNGLRIAVLELLGRSSLQVFTAHIPVCILADGLLSSFTVSMGIALQGTLLALMFSVMLLVAWRADAPRRRALVRAHAVELRKSA